MPKRPNPHHCPHPGTALQGLYPEHKCHMATKGTVKILTVLGEFLAHGKAKMKTSLCFPPLPPPITPVVKLHSAWGGPAATRKHLVHASNAHASTPLRPPESYTRKVILMNSIQLRGALLSLQIAASFRSTALLPSLRHRSFKVEAYLLGMHCTSTFKYHFHQEKSHLTRHIRMSYVHHEKKIFSRVVYIHEKSQQGPLQWVEGKVADAWSEKRTG